MKSDLRSNMGYKKGSPFENELFNIINTKNSRITMNILGQ